MSFAALSSPKDKAKSDTLRQRSRDRGVILTHQGWQKLQVAKQHLADERNFGQRFTREQLSELTMLSLNTISRILKRKDAVDRQSIEQFFTSFNLDLEQGDCALRITPFAELAARQRNPQQDWGEAVDVSIFYGREAELARLRQWVLLENCRLVTLLGMGGMGKSSLAVKLGLQIQSEFERVVWRSLQNSPPLEELLDSILQSLQQGESIAAITWDDRLDSKLSALMESLRYSRCLLILDNFETLLSSGTRAGQWQEGYECYSQLLRHIGEVPHRSCMILTSREKPGEIALLQSEQLLEENITAAARTLQLKGLSVEEGRELFRQKGQFAGTETEWQTLVQYFGGNPLALKWAAATTQEIFCGRISEVLAYMEQGKLVFEDVRDLLERQFQRLTQIEQAVILWFASHPDPVTVANLMQASIAAPQELLTAINSLLRRSLIEQGNDGFILQPIAKPFLQGG
jgi:NB-ARC domain